MISLAKAVCLLFVASAFAWLAVAPAHGATRERRRDRVRSAEPPEFSVRGGVFTNAVEVKLTSASSAASVRFTLDGSEPTDTSAAAEGSLTITNCVVVRARAFEPGRPPSEIASQTYTMLSPELAEFSSNLPLVIVNSPGREIARDTKAEVSMRLVETAGGRASLRSREALDVRALMNIRGRASANYLKCSYTVKLVDEDGDPQAVSLLGLPRDADWVLYGPHPDKTLMRDVLAYEWHRQMGHWAPRTQFAELFVNDNGAPLTREHYVGVYVLVERVQRAKHRVALAKLGPDDVAEPAITGGYLFKKDHGDSGPGGTPDLFGTGNSFRGASNRFGFPTPPGGFPADSAGFLPTFTGRTTSSSSSSSSSSRRTSRRGMVTNYLGGPRPSSSAETRRVVSMRIFYIDGEEVIERSYDDDIDESSWRTTLRTNHFYFVEPEPDEITGVQRAWLKRYVDDCETALYGPDFRDATKGYAAFLDPNSFIDYHLIVEATKNVDGFRFSTFYSKDRGGRLKMEPIWDWNLSLGNANGKQGWIPEYWLWPQLDDREYTWFRRLFEDPDFGQRYVDRWTQLRTNVFATDRILARIDELAALLQEAQTRNFERWPVLGQTVHPSTFVGETYAEEVNWLKDYVRKRLAWIERQFLPAPKATRVTTGDSAAGETVRLDSALGTIHFTLNGTDPRASGGERATHARRYESNVALKSNDTLFARVQHEWRWSAPLVMRGAAQAPSK